MRLFINGINLFPFIFLFFLVSYFVLPLLLQFLLNHLDFRNIRILAERLIKSLLSVYRLVRMQQIENRGMNFNKT
jgi:hypothetical protein